MLYQLSYEATLWERGQFVEFISSREEWNGVKYIWSNSYVNWVGRRSYELNKLTSLLMCDFIAQLVEHRTGIRGGRGFESREALIFPGLFFPIAKIGIIHMWPAVVEDMNSTNWPRSHNVLLHSSVGRASHRYSLRSRVRIPLRHWFCQASSFQLLKLEKFTAMTSFHLPPQFTYELFHIYFTPRSTKVTYVTWGLLVECFKCDWKNSKFNPLFNR